MKVERNEMMELEEKWARFKKKKKRKENRNGV